MPARKKTKGNTVQKQNGRQSVDSEVKSICDIMRRGNMTSALQYVPELSWLLFLRLLDDNEAAKKKKIDAVGKPFSPTLEAPFRWRDWAANTGARRQMLVERTGDAFLRFVNDELLPHLKKLRDKPEANKRQKVVSQIVRGIDHTRFTSQRDMLDVLDRINKIRPAKTDDTHMFTLSQVYEGLLLKMGEKNKDGGQFFTPREVIRVMTRVIAPKIGETVYDPCCGTGGFLAQAREYMAEARGKNLSAAEITTLAEETFYGREKETLAYPIALANLVLHGIDFPRVWHGNTLSKEEVDGTLFPQAAAAKLHDVVLTNPPFGGIEGRGVQDRFDYPTASTQALFVQEILESLKARGRCGIVIDEGFLFRTSEDAFARTKRRLLKKFDLHCIVSLPSGVFTQAGAGVKTNLLFFKRGKATEKIWYYDLSDVKVTRRQPLTIDRFDDFFRLLPSRADSKASWTVDFAARLRNALEKARPHIEEAEKLAARADPESQKAAKAARNEAKKIEHAAYDIKAVNPNKTAAVDTRSPAELLAAIKENARAVKNALDELSAIK